MTTTLTSKTIFQFEGHIYVRPSGNGVCLLQSGEGAHGYDWDNDTDLVDAIANLLPVDWAGGYIRNVRITLEQFPDTKEE